MAEKIFRDPNADPLTRTQILIAIGVTAVLLLIIAKIWQRIGSVTLVSLEWRSDHLLLGLGLGLVITGLGSGLYWGWSMYRRSADTYLQLVLHPLSWPDLMWLALLPGLSEELLFRGVMLPSLGMNGFGLLCSSLCFGILHVSNTRCWWPYVLWATLVGFGFGGCVLITDNLLIPVVAHITTNLASSCLWKLTQHLSE